MNLRSTFLISSIIASNIAYAQKISFDQTTINVGSTLWHHPVTATFKYKSRDRNPLIIETVDPGCGCLSPVFTSTPQASGTEGTISITYDANILGHFDRIILVKTNASPTPIRLRMKGNVGTGLKRTIEDLYPVRIGDVCLSTNNVEFPDVVRGDSVTARIEILNDTKEVYEPQLMHLPSYVTARYTPKMLSRGRRGFIDLTLNADRLSDTGLTQNTVYLARYSGDKVSHENEIVLSSIMLPDAKIYANEANHPQLNVSTTNLDLGKLGRKTKLKGNVTISNTGNGILRLTSIQVFNSTVQVALPKRELVPGESIQMSVTLLAKYLKSAKSEPRVLIICNDPNHLKETINVRFE